MSMRRLSYIFIFIMSSIAFQVVPAGMSLAQTWGPQASGTANLLSGVWFTDVQNGWVVGDAGTSISTNDGGQSWNSVFLTVEDLQAVAFADQNLGLIVGDNGLILRTTNGGLVWTPVASGTASNLRAVIFGAGGLAYAAGRDGVILRSTDSGASWSVVETGATRYQDAAAMGMQNAWIVGDGGVIRATTNGGATWFNQPSGTGSDLQGVHFISASEGWVAGQNSTLRYTSNGGASWVARSTGINVGLDAVSFANSNEGWAVGNLGAVFHSTNGGILWVAENSGTVNELNDVFFRGVGAGWAVGDLGTIIFRGQIAGIGEPLANAPSGVALLASHPNPFHRATTIGYALQSDSPVTLRLYDQQGRMVATLDEGLRTAGQHRLEWEPGDLAAGVYFYRLEAGSFSETRRMTLLK
jgi:photosystem II stability/assembly factor-like uncharacterized protein